MSIPQVSVIIPVYNGQDFIVATLDSVFKQSYKNYEIIVVDDGSNDGTKEVLSPYINKLHYIYHDNGGVSLSRNVGIKMSHGDWIAFLDHDDIWEREKLEIMMRAAQENPDVALMASDACSFNQSGILEESIMVFSNNYPKDTLKYFLQKYSIDDGCIVRKNIYEELLRWGNLLSVSTVMLRRACFDEVGLFRPEWIDGLRLAEDYDLWIRVSKYYDLLYVNRRLARYRIDSKSESGCWEKRVVKYSHWEALTLEVNFNVWNSEEKKIVHKRITQLYFDSVWTYFKQKKYQYVMKLALRSLKFAPCQWKLYGYMVISFFKELLNKMNLSYQKT